MAADREAEMKGSQGAAPAPPSAAAAEPVIGVPYAYPPSAGAIPANGVIYPPLVAPQQMPPPHYQEQQHFLGSVPPNAIVGHPNGIPLLETVFGDTPAPFVCSHCGTAGVTRIKSKISLATFVACLISCGVCFLCPSCDCLWHKEHFCPSCSTKVAEFTKSDPCAVIDPMQWLQPSYAIPA
ncbi:GSH-induced LITAF domain protein [Selaginella moellendorffii]|uniref:GSH-induced LITAF domain protein n=1 Tax=Selaginella moellendorffii TaxID=88036 RepID=UPI000D1C78D4|nr:GSH-induced LITAF domain protein [Selaginella moellendorffii]XP_024515570.1 GSH-induced LITAF domain protein [Selaginella moellendorffii]|eukprot:XP_002985838.2 GSH-induced LITAF domain protein [Selaginella moellendorffii]